MATPSSFALTIMSGARATVYGLRKYLLECEVVFVAALMLIALGQYPDTIGILPESTLVVSGDALAINNLEKTFEGIGYTLDRVRTDAADVPRIIISAVPQGLTEMRVIDRRKRLFFRSVLPLILTANEEIAADRQRLLKIIYVLGPDGAGEKDVSTEDAAWIDELAEKYHIDLTEENISFIELADVLKLRVALIPTSLALAQAVEESAWGTSRFARQGNALFGQWVWNEFEGIVPEQQRGSQEYAVRAFETPLDSVISYARNLNTHWAYTKFREERALMLSNEQVLDGWKLAETLTRYSERGPAYVKSLHAIMRVNGLRPLDNAQLATPEAMKELAQN